MRIPKPGDWDYYPPGVDPNNPVYPNAEAQTPAVAVPVVPKPVKPKLTKEEQAEPMFMKATCVGRIRRCAKEPGDEFFETRVKFLSTNHNDLARFKKLMVGKDCTIAFDEHDVLFLSRAMLADVGKWKGRLKNGLTKTLIWKVEHPMKCDAATLRLAAELLQILVRPPMAAGPVRKTEQKITIERRVGEAEVQDAVMGMTADLKRKWLEGIQRSIANQLSAIDKDGKLVEAGTSGRHTESAK